jgi:hypothetical protein
MGSKKRDERVRKEKIAQRKQLIKQQKLQNEMGKLQQQARPKMIPIVNKDDNVLERNIKVLEVALAEHEALQKTREENQGKAPEQLAQYEQDYKALFDAETNETLKVSNEVANVLEAAIAHPEVIQNEIDQEIIASLREVK